MFCYVRIFASECTADLRLPSATVAQSRLEWISHAVSVSRRGNMSAESLDGCNFNEEDGFSAQSKAKMTLGRTQSLF